MTTYLEVPTSAGLVETCRLCGRLLPPRVLGGEPVTLCGPCAGAVLDELAGVPARQPFDRKAHCQRIGAAGGRTTAERHGRWHMSSIGKAGARQTINRHGVSYFQGLIKRKGWNGRIRPSLAVDFLIAEMHA